MNHWPPQKQLDTRWRATLVTPRISERSLTHPLFLQHPASSILKHQKFQISFATESLGMRNEIKAEKVHIVAYEEEEKRMLTSRILRGQTI
jgi:hypothetical protein